MPREPRSLLRDAPRLARRLLRTPARMVRRQILPRVIFPARITSAPENKQVRVVGLLSSASGIGKSGRLCIDTLRQAGYRVSSHDVATLFAADDGVAFDTDGDFVRGGSTIYHLNPPMMLPALIRSGLNRYYGSYNIGYWAWELEALPDEWVDAIRFMHAIMVPSRFCQTAVRRYTSKPVVVVPHPVSADASPQTARQSDGRFNVVNVFRFGSSFERKNPIGLVKAFRLAFGDDSTARLILKTSDAERFPGEMAQLRAAIGGSDNIELIDAVWPADRVEELIRNSGAYASLHRSEGFGLPLAEAMMAGIPVLATDWSGNTDFCTAAHTYPVNCSLVAFHDHHGDYEQVRDGRWADPSIECAADQLRLIRANPEAANEKASAARTALTSYIASNGYQRALESLQNVAPQSTARTSP